MKKGIIIGVLIVLIVLSLVLFSGNVKESPANSCSYCDFGYTCTFTPRDTIIGCECILPRFSGNGSDRTGEEPRPCDVFEDMTWSELKGIYNK